MRYWAYFSAKVVVAGGVLYGLLVLLDWSLPKATKLNEYDDFRNGFLHLQANLALMGWFLLAAGTLYLIIRDQRYRCRVCLRRLRMPIETGSWGQMLQLGRPRTEYICPYGHGTLTAEELQISGLANPQWKQHSDDIWDELYAASKESRRPEVTGVPLWRVAAGIAVLTAMAGLLAVFTPIYLHNLQLQNFVGALTQEVASGARPDAELRAMILQKAHALDLPVAADNVQVFRSPETLRIEVRYLVPVKLPGYAVNLHFYPGAGSRP